MAIHATEVPADPPRCLLEEHAWKTWEPAPLDALRRTPRVAAVIAVARQLQEDLAAGPPVNVFVHDDFHPGNVAWRGGRLSAVLDWNDAKLGPAVSDVPTAPSTCR